MAVEEKAFMKKHVLVERIAIFVLLIAVICTGFSAAQNANEVNLTLSGTIKWAEFNIPYAAMNRALNLDVGSHNGTVQLHWVEELSYLGAKYGGNWNKYRTKDIDDLSAKLKSGQSLESLTDPLKNYDYFYKIYNATLGNFVGDFTVQVKDASGEFYYEQRYGLKVFSPIAAGYGYSHYDDFGSSRSFGFSRRHLGNDLMGSIGTPIVAVEGGYIESIGWNYYGGWRIGIRSFDKQRYYYYAHLRKDHPYIAGLKEGDVVRSGDVIGYLGMTGYSTTENVNKMQKPHLHFGMQLVFDDGPRESNNEVWLNVYNIINLLARNRVPVKSGPKDYTRIYDFIDNRYQLYYE